MRIVIAAAMIALLSGAAHAQAPAINLLASPEKPVTEDEVKKQEQLDRAYKAATEKNKAAAAQANDPWGNVRGAEQPAAKPKTSDHSKPKIATKPKTQAQSQPQQQTQSPWPPASTPR